MNYEKQRNSSVIIFTTELMNVKLFMKNSGIVKANETRKFKSF